MPQAQNIIYPTLTAFRKGKKYRTRPSIREQTWKCKLLKISFIPTEGLENATSSEHHPFLSSHAYIIHLYITAVKCNKLRYHPSSQNIIRPEAHSTKKQQAHNSIYSNARVNISSISMITAMKMEQTQIHP